ncbi:MAG: GNAT family N-acetyltransferase [Bacteroidetes bacterium]|nr:GNAT family N-acetyltransferase [Bacteroidota bacterium]
MITIERFRKSERPELANEAFAIRQEVFVIEQKVDPELEYDEFEELAEHYLLLEDGVPMVTARWRRTEKGIKLERFATRRPLRNRGLGAILLDRILKDVLPAGVPVYLHSQLLAVPFYERRGFRKEGDIFSEADILHYKMVHKG